MSTKACIFIIVLTTLSLGLFCISDPSDLLNDNECYPIDVERQVLMEIYSNTNGEHWLTNTRWNSTETHCSWYGIKCNCSTILSPVTEIVLPDNNISGFLPGNLWKLRFLETLIVNSNKGIKGKLQNFISANMTKLKKLDLSFCSLEGVIPESITLLKNLQELRLCSQRGNTKLNGVIPSGIANLINLNVLGLGDNNFSGSLPQGIGVLRNLKVLDLESVNISSSHFDIFQNLSNLQSLNLSKTEIGGELPSNLGKLFPKMTELLLPGNHLKGPIPHSIASIKTLTRLSLANNRLSGAIPGNITHESQLKFIDISRNNFTSIQFDRTNVSFISERLEILLLNHNTHLNVSLSRILRGSKVHDFNEEQKRSSMLNVLNISNCGFYGRIPKSLWSFGSLIYLDISNNELSGPVPEVLTSMYSLLYIDMSNNQLQGPIPPTILKLEALHYLDVRGNKEMTEFSKEEQLCSNKPSQFIAFDPHLMNKNKSGNFRCPMTLLRVTNGSLLLDPEYYKYYKCKCDHGYYGECGRCRKCMKGGKCLGGNNMTIQKGFWPEPNPSNVSSFIPCNSNPGFFTDEKLSSCSPNGDCICTLDKPNRTVCKSNCLCMEGSVDRLCSRCKERWYKTGNICRKCPSHHHATFLFIAVLLASLLMFVLALFYLKNRPRLGLLVIYGQITILFFLRCFNIIPGWVFEVNVIILLFYLAGMGSSTKGLLKIAVFYLQILDAMVSTYKLWPQQILKGQQYISSLINFHFPGLMCDIPNLYTPTGQFTTLILLPIVCIILSWVFYSLVWIACQIEVGRWSILSIKYHCLQITVTCLNLTYFPIVLRSIAVLASCQDQKFMRIAPWIQCNSPTSSLLLSLAWLSTLVYVVGVPIFIFLPLLLCYVRANKRARLTKQEKDAMDKWLGSIYLPYKEEYRSFCEVYALLRKLLLAFMIGYIPEVSSLQTFFVSLVLAVALVFHLVFQPYQSSLGWVPIENILETIVLVVLQHSFILLRFTTVEDSDNRVMLLWLIVEVNGLVVLFLILIISVLLAKRAAKSLKSRSRNESYGTTSNKFGIDCLNSKNSHLKPLLKPLLFPEDKDS